jgi:hypothetical protein
MESLSGSESSTGRLRRVRSVHLAESQFKVSVVVDMNMKERIVIEPWLGVVS